MKRGKFEYWRTAEHSYTTNGNWYWHLIAANGKIICQSEGYKTRAGCIKGIESVKGNAPRAKLVEL
jgi:uncharacterized protein YegP (UPF0339 family)